MQPQSNRFSATFERKKQHEKKKPGGFPCVQEAAPQRGFPGAGSGSGVTPGASSPVMGTSGLGCSFRHRGTKTVTWAWPRSRKKSTASWIPRQENTSLFPWLRHKSQSQRGPAAVTVAQQNNTPGVCVQLLVAVETAWPSHAG